jgi:hypothetical protein
MKGLSGRGDIRRDIAIYLRLLPYADAVVFDGRYAPVTVLPAHQNPDQYFVFASHESPIQNRTKNAVPMLPPRYFNLTMTYRSHSDIDYAYGRFDPITADTHESEIWRWNEVSIAVDDMTPNTM